MSKIYVPPSITTVSALPEGQWRALLAPLLLMPPEASTTDRWLYRTALDTLFTAECDAALHTLQAFAQKHATPQRYHADLSCLVSDLMTAAAHCLRTRDLVLTVSLRGEAPPAAVYPRYLQLGLISLLRSAFQKGTAAQVIADTACFSFRIRGNLSDAVLSLPRAVAALHGGRLLQCGDTVTLAFLPETTKTVYPRWQSPGIDGLLHDPLSYVRTAFITLRPAAHPKQ